MDLERLSFKLFHFQRNLFAVPLKPPSPRRRQSGNVFDLNIILPRLEMRQGTNRKLIKKNQAEISVKIRVWWRKRITRARGVWPAGSRDSRRASVLPGPDASTQTRRAAAITWYPIVMRFGGGLAATTGR